MTINNPLLPTLSAGSTQNHITIDMNSATKKHKKKQKSLRRTRKTKYKRFNTFYTIVMRTGKLFLFIQTDVFRDLVNLFF